MDNILKILLAVPTFHYSDKYPAFLSVSDFPSGYAYLSAALQEAGHEVFGLNLNNITGYPSAYAMIYAQIRSTLEQVEPDMVAMGGLCVEYQCLRDMIKIVREFRPNTPIVLGGRIVTHDADFIMNQLKPDFGIIGEGEKAIVQLANNEPLETIDNLGYWAMGKAIFTKKNFDYGHADNLPLPDWESFGIKEMLDDWSASTRMLYRYPRAYPKPMIIVTARGCPFDCSFCVHGGDRIYRPHSIDRIMKEIAQSYERYHFNILIIQDELFAINNQRMRDFCTTLIKERKAHGWDFDWMMQTHANAKLDLKTLKLAKESGCYLFSYGLESASPTILESMNKKTKPSQIIETIALAHAANIAFAGNLLFGDVAETEDTLRETIEFFFQYANKSGIFMGFVKPYPGSKLFDICVERGIIKNKLKFYEELDNQNWNMTTLPNELWLEWANFVVMLERTRSLPMKNANITHYAIEPLETRDSVAVYMGHLIWQLWSKCPHCDGELFYREQGSELDGKRGLHHLGVACPHCGKAIRINLLDDMQKVECSTETK